MSHSHRWMLAFYLCLALELGSAVAWSKEDAAVAPVGRACEGGIECDAVMELEFPCHSSGLPVNWTRSVVLYLHFWVTADQVAIGIPWAEPMWSAHPFPGYPPTTLIYEEPQAVGFESQMLEVSQRWQKPVNCPLQEMNFNFRDWRYGLNQRDHSVFRNDLVTEAIRKSSEQQANPNNAPDENIRAIVDQGQLLSLVAAQSGHPYHRIDYEYESGKLRRQIIRLSPRKIFAKPNPNTSATVNHSQQQIDEIPLFYPQGGRTIEVTWNQFKVGSHALQLPETIEVRVTDDGSKSKLRQPFEHRIVVQGDNGASSTTVITGTGRYTPYRSLQGRPLQKVTFSNYTPARTVDRNHLESERVRWSDMNAQEVEFAYLNARCWAQKWSDVTEKDRARFKDLASYFSEVLEVGDSVSTELKAIHALTFISMYMENDEEVMKCAKKYVAILNKGGLSHRTSNCVYNLGKMVRNWNREEMASKLDTYASDLAQDYASP